MVSKIIISLCAIFIIIIAFDRIQYNPVLKFYFKTYINSKSKEQVGLKKLLFYDYLEKFNKTYGRDEFPMRFALFKENLKKVRKLNRGLRKPTFGITKFSDWSKEELDSILTHPLHNKKSCEPIDLLQCNDSPRDFQRPGKILPTLDWRKSGAVGLIQNQRKCNACWAFSIIGVMESMFSIKYGTFTSLSIQELIDCSYDSIPTGCLRGRPLVEALKYICSNNMRIATEKDYPLTFVEKPLRDCSAEATWTRTMKNFVNSCTMKDNETRLLEVLNRGPVTALVDARHLFNYNGRDHSIIDANCETSIDDLNHAVQIVGYDNTAPTPYYIVRNSWDTDWGDKGYARLAIGGNQCGIAYSIGYLEVN